MLSNKASEVKYALKLGEKNHPIIVDQKKKKKKKKRRRRRRKKLHYNHIFY